MDHYFHSRADLPHEYKQIRFALLGYEFSLLTDSGTFCRDRLDYGTELMLKALGTYLKNKNDLLPLLQTRGVDVCKVLDLGCGNGVVSLVLSQILQQSQNEDTPNWELFASDINERAVQLAKNNLRNLNLPHQVLAVDGVPHEYAPYHLIATNPPFRAGKATVNRLLKESYEALALDGELWVVVQNKQGAKSLQQYLKNLAGECVVIDKSAGYRVLQVIKSE